MFVGRTPAALALALLAGAGSARAQEQEAGSIRQEIEALRREFTERMAALEARLATVEARAEAPAAAPAPAQAAPAPSPPAAEAAVPAGAAGAGGPEGALPVYGGAPSSKVFNPDIAAIGNFLGTIGKSPGSGEPSLEMHESELTFQAVVDPYARADVFLTFGPDEVGIEESFLTFPTLPGGFLVKVGRMRDAFGKVDAMHAHVLPWTDRPLVNRNLLGGEDALTDDGISVSHLIPNPFLFLEATGQVYQGSSAVFAAPTRGDLAYVGHLRGYKDLSESTNLDLGGSFAYGHNGLALGGDANVDPGLATAEGTTRIWGVDLTLRHRPLRRAIYTRTQLRGEAVWSQREQPGGVQDAFGAYGYLEHQFARRWFAGARFDLSDRADDASIRDKGASLLLTYWPSEFSQLRAQYRHTRFGDGESVNELLFQLLFAIGAHGAHPF